MDETSTALVEVNPNEFAVFGPLELSDVVIEPVTLLPHSAVNALSTAAGTALAAGNVGIQAASALGAFQGLVRLAPATLQALQAGAVPLSNGAANLGTLVDGAGRFVHSVQWMGAGPTGLAAQLPTLGPAMVLFAIQMQLTRISRLTEENLRLSNAMLQELRTEHWATVEGYQATMRRMIREAQKIGAVNSHIWANVSGSAGDIETIRTHFRKKAETHTVRLQSLNTPLEMREYVDHHGDALLRDVQGLLQAQSTWFAYEAIRAGYIHSTLDQDPSAEAHLEEVVRAARAEHEADLRHAADLTAVVLRRASSMRSAKNSGVMPFGRKKQAAEEVAAAGRVIADQITLLRANWKLLDPAIQTPVVSALKRGMNDPLVDDILRWHLLEDERLLAIASVRAVSSIEWGWGLPTDHFYLAVTDQRLLMGEQDHVRESGDVDQVIPVDQLRYVRYSPATTEPRKRARLDLTFAEHDLHLEFNYTSTPRERTQVDDFAQLLKSRMALPPQEVPEPPTRVLKMIGGASSPVTELTAHSR